MTATGANTERLCVRCGEATVHEYDGEAWVCLAEGCGQRADDDDRRSLDDDGNAHRIGDRYSQRLRYLVGEGYAEWDGTRWRHDDDGAAMRVAREVADAMRARMRQAREQLGDKDDLTKALAAHAKRSGSERGISSMLKLATSDLRLVLRPEQLDADPYLLNAQNGTVDLRTGELRPHDRADLISRRAAAAYEPAALAPTWKAFLETVLPDETVRRYVQKMAGAAALGDNRDELLHVLYGGGANGKSKFTRTVAAALGDYAATAGADMLLADRRHSAGQPELVRLRGARLLVASETDESARLNVALVKALTGGDTIAARLLYANAIVEFVPVFSPWLATNHRPVIGDQSEAVWRRVKLVPFEVTIPRNDRDPSLQGKLLAELPGVLAWIVAGVRDYLAEGLDPPEAVEAATASYRDEENTVGRFATERCRFAADDWESASVLYRAWGYWCEANGETTGTQTSFGRRLSELRDEHGKERFPKDRVGDTRVRRGLSLIREEGS